MTQTILWNYHTCEEQPLWMLWKLLTRQQRWLHGASVVIYRCTNAPVTADKHSESQQLLWSSSVKYPFSIFKGHKIRTVIHFQLNITTLFLETFKNQTTPSAMWLLINQLTVDFGPVANSTRFTSFLEKSMTTIVVTYRQCLLRGNVSAPYTIKNGIREDQQHTSLYRKYLQIHVPKASLPRAEPSHP